MENTELMVVISSAKLLYQDKTQKIISPFCLSIMAEDLPKSIFSPEKQSLFAKLVEEYKPVLEYHVQGMSFDLGLDHSDLDDASLSFKCSENGISSMLMLSGEKFDNMDINVYNSVDGKQMYCQAGSLSHNQMSPLLDLGIIDKKNINGFYRVNGVDVDFLMQHLQKLALTGIGGQYGLDFTF